MVGERGKKVLECRVQVWNDKNTVDYNENVMIAVFGVVQIVIDLG
jgi:hypothetical protein